MYEARGNKVLTRVAAIPKPDAGAPMPCLVAHEAGLVVAYYASYSINWNTARPEDLDGEEVVVLLFKGFCSFMFGAPNDEALHGHPLAPFGLESYAAFRVEDSPWARRHEEINRVHYQHRPDGFARLLHFIIAFHDSTFECLTSEEPEVTRMSATMPHEAAVASMPEPG